MVEQVSLSTAASTVVSTPAKFATLLDPCGDRRVKTLDPPATRHMEIAQLFPAAGRFNLFFERISFA